MKRKKTKSHDFGYDRATTISSCDNALSASSAWGGRGWNEERSETPGLPSQAQSSPGHSPPATIITSFYSMPNKYFVPIGELHFFARLER